MKLQRFLLFSAENYYPNGGWHDFRGSFDNLLDATMAGAKLADEGYGWYHVVDLDNAEITAGSRLQGYGAGDLDINKITEFPQE